MNANANWDTLDRETYASTQMNAQTALTDATTTRHAQIMKGVTLVRAMLDSKATDELAKTSTSATIKTRRDVTSWRRVLIRLVATNASAILDT